MTTVNFSINHNIGSSQPKFNFQDFLRQHRLFAVLLMVGTATLFTAIVIFLFMSKPTEPQQEPEDPPYLTFENTDVLEHPIQEALSGEILFNLQLILLEATELDSAPTDNSGDKNYLVSFDEASYSTSNISTIDNGELYTMNLSISDGRKYTLRLLVNCEYHSEYAVAILDRTDKHDSQDYIITFTSNTSDYYLTLGTDKANNASNSSSITDHITGAPLTPIPDSAADWIGSLKLTTPKTIYATLPSIR